MTTNKHEQSTNSTVGEFHWLTFWYIFSLWFGIPLKRLCSCNSLVARFRAFLYMCLYLRTKTGACTTNFDFSSSILLNEYLGCVLFRSCFMLDDSR